MPETEKLSLKTKLAYGIGGLGCSVTANIRTFFLLFFLTNVAGLNPTIAGTVLLISKIWDAVNDPLIGFLSDRTRSPWGRRYPWMVLGAVPFGVFFFLQWVVPHFSTNPISNQWSQFWYYVAIALLFNTAYTAVVLPFRALAPELTSDYNERTSLISFQSAFTVGGGMLGLILAQLVFSKVADPSQKYLVLGGVCAFICVLPIYLCVWGTRSCFVALPRQLSENHSSTSLPLLSQIRTVVSNRAFVCVTGIYLCSWLGVQLTAAILPYFVINWMKLPDRYLSQTAILVQGTALIMMFIWSRISKQVGKKAVYFLGMPLLISAQAGLFFLHSGQVGLLYGLAVLAGVGISIAYLVPWSMLPDVIDLDELISGQRREGIFYGFMVQFQKVGLGLALFLVGKVLDWAGFIPTVAGQAAPNQPDAALLAIRLLVGPVPAFTIICGLVLNYFYPITSSVHAEILLKLGEYRDTQSHETP